MNWKNLAEFTPNKLSDQLDFDPIIEVRPTMNQIDDLIEEIQKGRRRRTCFGDDFNQKMAEELTKYFTRFGIRTRYIHSDVETLERIQIMQDLRTGLFDVLVGVNLLREGLDLPEVSLVAILMQIKKECCVLVVLWFKPLVELRET